MKKVAHYIWLDGYSTPNLRMKKRVIEYDPYASDKDLNTIFKELTWSFDGSSTQQAEGTNSDCILQPVRILLPKSDKDAYILCEVMIYENDKLVPHSSNTRAKLREITKNHLNKEFWFGIEQEYFIYETELKPYNWPEGYPNPQGRYYCGIGGDVAWGREISDNHLNTMLDFGICVSGTNGEVAPSQWEYQIGPGDPLLIADYLWFSRYLLNLEAEKHKLNIKLNPKPIKGDWNGSGAHVNFSTKQMREHMSQEYLDGLIESLRITHEEHIAEYGEYNHERLTGLHETCSIKEFKAGYADRTCSIRIPNSVKIEGKGYLEDRRPAANLDPYKALAKLIETIGNFENTKNL